jgi:glycosyltransferase involved in cell wall biosynthesis
MPQVPSTPKVLVVTGEISDSFMRDDLRIIHQFAEVGTLELGKTPAPGGPRVGRAVRYCLNFGLFVYRLLRYNMRAVIFWFASQNYSPAMALIAKLLGRRVVVITGGKDAVYVPDIDWGDLKTPKSKSRFRRLMRHADSVLPFSDSARQAIATGYTPRHIRTAYPAIDARFFAPTAPVRAPRVVTCCYEYSEQNIVQKGLDQFVEAARRLPEIPFVLVGHPADEAARSFAASVPKNVTVLPRIPGRTGYRDFLAASGVYAQLSAHEGFGVSVAESMACGCIPVVSDRYSLPEVVGDTGFVIRYGDIEDAIRAIRSAIKAPPEARARARCRVARFDRESRVEVLYDELSRLIPELKNPPLRVELGCGSTGVAGTLGVDARRTIQTRAVCDVRYSCFKSDVADEVYSFCVLEHLDDPYQLLDEVSRILKPDGRAYLRVPNLGTFSSHLDPTHRFLADLRIWREIMEGYFENVTVVPEGLKYRDNRLLTFINWMLVRGLRFYELTQGWTFVCQGKRATPSRAYTGWWQERALDR